MDKKKYFITVSNGLIDRKHYEKMGAAIWHYLWLLDKTTKIEYGWGYVLGGKGIKLEDIKFSTRMTSSRNIQRLEKEGYILTSRETFGIRIKIRNIFKKFSKNRNENVESRNRNVASRNENVESRNRNVASSIYYTEDNTEDYTKDRGLKPINQIINTKNVKK
jgi:hypothetical protein